MANLKFPIFPDLKDKTVLITGGSSGIGASFVEAFANQGCRVAFVDIQNKSSKELEQNNTLADFTPMFINCDLSNINALK